VRSARMHGVAGGPDRPAGGGAEIFDAGP
jgi:hypothetical protein